MSDLGRLVEVKRSQPGRRNVNQSGERDIRLRLFPFRRVRYLDL